MTPTKFFALALLLSTSPAIAASSLEEIRDCTLVETDWADGDSFRVRTPLGQEHTVRLYGADCLEWHVTDSSDARRLRAQRRYFGITEVGGGPAGSIELAKQFGQQAAQEVAALLEKPFVIYSSFADARGDSRYQRVYAFVVTADGRDLAAHLVSAGLARAFGVSRKTFDGRTRDE
ncbi:MAG: thermonuclease family protein [Verrucomicrobiales bacterium]